MEGETIEINYCRKLVVCNKTSNPQSKSLTIDRLLHLHVYGIQNTLLIPPNSKHEDDDLLLQYSLYLQHPLPKLQYEHLLFS